MSRRVAPMPQAASHAPDHPVVAAASARSALIVRWSCSNKPRCGTGGRQERAYLSDADFVECEGGAMWPTVMMFP